MPGILVFDCGKLQIQQWQHHFRLHIPPQKLYMDEKIEFSYHCAKLKGIRFNAAAIRESLKSKCIGFHRVHLRQIQAILGYTGVLN